MSLHQHNHQKLLKTLISIIFILRISIIFIPLNYDYPDEYWQGPQIAYKINNNLFKANKKIGIETWQWTIDDPIRNPVYQYLLAAGYVMMDLTIKFVDVFQQHFGFSWLTISQQAEDRLIEVGPKIVQALFAIIGDIFMVKLFLLNFDNKSSKKNFSIFQLIFLLTNWFYLSMLSRTYINSFQCILTTVAFYYQQLHYLSNSVDMEKNGSFDHITSKNDIKSRLIVLLAYVSRPTSLIPWIVIWPFEMISYLLKLKEKKKVAKEIIKISIQIIAKNILQIFLMILSSLIISSLYYHKLTLTEWNFFYYNVVLKWSSYFETHSFHFYFTHSLPFMEVGYLLFLIVGLWEGLRWSKKVDRHAICLQEKLKQQMLRTICWMTLTFLFIQTLISQHKQHRFLLILEPFLMIVQFKGFLVLKNYFSTNQKNGSRLKVFYCILGLIILVNVFMFWSIAFYPKGGFNLLREVRNSIDKKQQTFVQDNQKIGIMYLCESHALPAYSVILRDVVIILPDESPMAKMNNSSMIDLLRKNPHEVYERFLKKINQKYGQSKVKVQFLIFQQKFIQIKLSENKDFGKIQSDKWKFIEKQYAFKSVENNRNFWEEIIFGPDYLYLYQKKQQTKQQDFLNKIN